MTQLELINKDLPNEKKIDINQLKAAYALNMCTVSVSQIVDYNDSYILEQEYDAILNNLNLEEIPKDDALLKTLVELLNTITFFRIQEIKKKQIEQKYQEQMKNAIWSAIPNLGVIVTSGNPVAIGVSLATQIGAGYMNYRKTKAQNKSAKADSEIELKITAIEQFNALKRELFTTAWRLAEKYNFDDKLRLTEKQISQYNEILMDGDEMRRYARLEAIQDKFQAYPPFWYFFGHAAACVADELDDEEDKARYFGYAKDCFLHYEMMNEFSILREDHLTASFALEFIDLLMLEENKDKEHISKLLNIAVEKAGNEWDVLQLCSIEALRIGNRDIAEKLLKILVNEDYNKTVNAQLLSCIYVQKRNYSDYEVLKRRVSPRFLFPMPSRDDNDVEKLTKDFEESQRKLLEEKFKLTLQALLAEYSQKFNRKISVFDLEEKYGDDFFEATERGQRIRRSKAERVLQDEEKKRYYLERLKNVSLPVVYTEIIDEALQNVLSVSIYSSQPLRERTMKNVVGTVSQNKENINKCQDRLKNGTFSTKDYDVLQNISIDALLKEAFGILYRSACNSIENASGSDLLTLDGNLYKLCENVGIKMPEISVGDTVEFSAKKSDNIPHLSENLFGAEAYVAFKENKRLTDMASYLGKAFEHVEISDNVRLFNRNMSSTEFNDYFNNGIFQEYPDLSENTLEVVQHFNDKYDLIFTDEGVVYLKKNKVGKKIPYSEIELVGDKLNLWGKKIKSNDVKLNSFFSVIKGFRGTYLIDSVNTREYVGTVADVAMLNRWFKNLSCVEIEGVEKVYAYPEQNLMESLGVSIDISEKDNCLLQFVYDTKSRVVLEYRIIEFETLSPKFKTILEQSNGVIRLA